MSISGNAPAGTGYVGSLTKEQAILLRRLWAALEEVLAKGTVTIQHDPVTIAAASGIPAVVAPAAQPVAASTGWGGGWFSTAATTSTTPEEAPKPLIEPAMTITLEELKIDGPVVRQAIRENMMGDHPDALVLRFLRARKWHVANGLMMMLKAFQWRLEMNVDDVKTLGELELEEKYPKFQEQLAMGKFYVHGTDKQGQPVVYLNVGLHRPADQDYRTLERLTIYLMEQGRLLISPPVECVSLVFDLSQFGLANMDYSLVKFLVQCFEAYYPESLGGIIVHKSPFVFWGVWKVIEPWLDRVVASKVKFTSTDAELLDFIPAEHLPSTYEGGLDQYRYAYVAPVPGENERMKDGETKKLLYAAWEKLADEFDAQTRAWIAEDEDEEPEGSNKDSFEIATKYFKERDAIARDLRKAHFALDPYVRARSQFHRGSETVPAVLRSDGSVKWTYTN
ncbi:hypothetical protein DFQ26_007511 [Actinomortierella ambigua]|nr:hypothetical protein DFQ26_007511 [Actinomortierella ambigua]